MSRGKKLDLYETIKVSARRSISILVASRVERDLIDSACIIAKASDVIAAQIASDLTETYRMMEIADIFERKVDR